MPQEKTALVLSAGGMFGAYQAGVWRAIADEVQIDMVAGASVGALNGYLIASGCSPRELANRWLDAESGSALRLFPNAGWRNGWFDPAPLRLQAERIVAEFVPRIPCAVIVVQLPRLRTVAVQYPEITAAHLQASCSIPLFLPSVRIEGRRCIDGGLLEKLPFRAAVEMGATRIIAIDALPRMPWWWLRRRYHPKGLDITVVSPSEYLGDWNDAVFWKRENIERWIDLGARDGYTDLRSKRLSADARGGAVL